MALIPRVREMLQRKEIMGQEGKTEFTNVTSLIFYPEQKQLILKRNLEEKRVFGIRELFSKAITTPIRDFETDSISLKMRFDYPVRVQCEEGVCEIIV